MSWSVLIGPGLVRPISAISGAVALSSSAPILSASHVNQTFTPNTGVLSATAYAANLSSTSAGVTTIPPATQILDSSQNIWTVTGGVVYENGVTAGYSANVVLLLWYGGVIYQENSSNGWYSWSAPTWTAVRGDPRVIAITTSSPLPSAVIGTLYLTTVAASGGTAPYVWSITADTPNTGSWLTINSSTGVLSGTPGTAETESVTVRVTDAMSNTASVVFSLNVLASVGKGLLSYLQGLPTGTTNRIIIGHHPKYYPTVGGSGESWPLWTNYAQFDPGGSTGTAANVTIPEYLAGHDAGGTSTGFAPALLLVTPGVQTAGVPALAYDGSSTGIGMPGSPCDAITLANAWLATGGIVLFNVFWGNPSSLSSYGGTTVNIGQLLTTGSAVQNIFFGWCDQVANCLKAIHGTVIFRHLHEMNGGWYWYGLGVNGLTGAQQAQIWVLVYNRIVTYNGVTNALWHYCPNCGGSSMAAYPGAAYVDIVGYDVYSDTPGQAGVSSGSYAGMVGTGKPIILGEFGSSPSTGGPTPGTKDSNAMLQDVKTHTPNVVGLGWFGGTWALSNQLNSLQVMTDAWSVTRSDLPSFSTSTAFGVAINSAGKFYNPATGHLWTFGGTTFADCENPRRLEGIAAISSATWKAAALKWGLNCIRVGINVYSWLGLSCVDNGNGAASGTYPAGGIGYLTDPNGDYQSKIKTLVANITAAGMICVLVPCLDCPKNLSGQPQCPTFEPCGPSLDYTPTCWISLANTFKTNPAVIFELWNEPFGDNNYNDSTSASSSSALIQVNGGMMSPWVDGSGPHVLNSGQAAAWAGTFGLIADIRATGATNVILAPPTWYSGVIEIWLAMHVIGGVNPDPLKQFGCAWHIYGSTGGNRASYPLALIAAGYPIIITETYGFNTTFGPANGSNAGYATAMADGIGVMPFGWENWQDVSDRSSWILANAPWSAAAGGQGACGVPVNNTLGQGGTS
jgi:hypothetical protein